MARTARLTVTPLLRRGAGGTGAVVYPTCQAPVLPGVPPQQPHDYLHDHAVVLHDVRLPPLLQVSLSRAALLQGSESPFASERRRMLRYFLWFLTGLLSVIRCSLGGHQRRLRLHASLY